MKELKGEWSGTLVLVAQPAEELILGAKAMVKDGLYKVAPQPDYLISSHVGPRHPIGAASVTAGRRMAGTDQMDVILHGVGGHGSAPHTTKEPIVMGSLAVWRITRSSAAASACRSRPSLPSLRSRPATPTT